VRADDIYRFVVLRQVSGRPPVELPDPFVPAYGDAPPAEGDLRQRVTNALSAGDRAGLRAACAPVASAHASAWELVSDPHAALFRDLPDLARRGDATRAWKVVVSRLAPPAGDGDGDGGDRPPPINGPVGGNPALNQIRELRVAVANYFTAVSLTGGATGDLDGAAHLICCLETLTRLIVTQRPANQDPPQADPGDAVADPATVPSWTLPLTRGVVVLPFAGRADGNAGPDNPDPGGERPGRVPQAGVPPVHARRFVGEMLGENAADADAPPYQPPASFVGDLVILKQQLRGYQLGEIAHVENIMAKEHFDRTFRSLRRSESRLLTAEEDDKEVSRDLQTTTRDELSTQIDTSMSQQVDLSANFNVNATYLGPSVTVTASVGAAAGYSRSSDERNSTASSHAQEVVSKASEKVRQHTLTQREQLEISETDDTSTHGFRNDDNESLVGVYRWLEKTFDLHLVNYGRRRIYEFMIPEPASYWTALLGQRGDSLSGPRPTPPTLPGAGNVAVPLTSSDFSLTAADGSSLEAPVRWAEIVQLATVWGVTLVEPPSATKQVHFALSVPGESNTNTDKMITRFGNNQSWFYESGIISRQAAQQPLQVPDGYEAYQGNVGLESFMYVRKRDNDYHQFERGYTFLFLNGKLVSMSIGVDPNEAGRMDFSLPDDMLMAANTTLQGDIPVAVATSLNGADLTIRLDCRRTKNKERSWADDMMAAFGRAYADRVARWEEDRDRAMVGNEDWGSALPSTTMRAIEVAELKRSVLSLMTDNALDDLGASVLRAGNDPAVIPPPPVLDPAHIDAYSTIVRFFEQVFDWGNMAYVFSQYFFGRKTEWTKLSIADNADAQFKAFLSAGAARVQVPVRLGYEAHAQYFFDRVGPLPSLEARIPWLGTMRAIAEDLAADAREGFSLGDGTVSVASQTDLVTGTGTAFADPLDIVREIRLGGKIHVIHEVLSPTRVRIRPAWAGADLTDVSYETGGIVVGDPIPLTLPTTLVAIDKPGLSLPTYPPRYGDG